MKQIILASIVLQFSFHLHFVEGERRDFREDVNVLLNPAKKLLLPIGEYFANSASSSLVFCPMAKARALTPRNRFRMLSNRISTY